MDIDLIEYKIPPQLILSVVRALVGEIYPEIRAIAIGLSDKNEFKIRYYLDREPDSFDYECISIVSAEIESDRSVHDQFSNFETECVCSNERLSDLDCLDLWVYARLERP